MERPHSHSFSRFVAVLAALALWLGVLAATPTGVQAQGGQVTGTVVNAGTLEPLSGAQVVVEGTERGGVTDENGQFRITGLSGTRVVLRVQMLGYRTATTEASVGATDVRIELEQSAIALEEIVVTGTAGGTRKRELGNAMTTIGAEVADVAPIQDVSDMLNGRAAGVVVQQGTGAVGSASEIRIRGTSSMSLDDAPLIYVDGVRINSRTQGAFGDPAVSRLNDIDPSSIESIEVIKGPAAATLYGTEASNGVIQIITKSGRPGETRWNATIRQGANWFRNAADRIPLNYYRDSDTGDVISANLVETEADRGTPVFETGRHQMYGLSVSGGDEDIRYFMSGNATLSDGVTPDNSSERYNGQLNLSVSPTPTLNIKGNLGFALNRIRVPRQGVRGMLPALLWGNPSTLDDAQRGFHIAPPEVMYNAYQHWQDANRFTPGLTVEHRPTDWFTQRLVFGVDFTDQQTVYYTPRLGPEEAQFFSQNFAQGSKTVNRESVLFTSFDYGATATHDLTDDLTTNTSVGFQVYAKSIEFMSAQGEGFPATGVKTVAGAGIQFGQDNYVENNTVGVYFQEQFGWKDRLFLTAAIRADDNSAFGENFDLVFYPKVSTSWVLSEEAFWGFDFINSFRLRAAYGESGQQPDAFAALRTFQPRSTPSGGAAVTPQTIGNPDLGPERGQEIEAGFETSMFDDRVALDFTFYDQRTTDAILQRNVAPSSGFAGQQFVNVGEISNRGVEVALNVRALETASFDWDLGLNVATNRNRITKLGIDDYLALGWTTRHQQGYPVGSFFAHEVVSADVGEDGVATNIMCDDGSGGSLPCFDSPRVYLGHPNPNVEGSFTTSMSFGDRVRVSGLVDFQLGQTKYVTDRWNRCAWRQVCEINAYPERFDPRAVGAVQLGGFDEFDWWIRESSFARLREISVDYTVPQVWSERFGADRGNITLAARNLGVWTDYPDLDPETMNVPNANEEPEDQALLPPLTQLMLTVRLTY